jgi:NAD(P)-dependent dehydrogenase (short-subunit alcohol dehydrogenase family)
MKPSRLVFVTGGTDYMGRRVIPALLARGHRVRALVREGSKAKLPSGCEAVVGNALDEKTFASRVAPADTFLQLFPPSRGTARRLYPVTLKQMIATLVAAVEEPATGVRIVETPEIRRTRARRLSE